MRPHFKLCCGRTSKPNVNRFFHRMSFELLNHPKHQPDCICTACFLIKQNTLLQKRVDLLVERGDRHAKCLGLLDSVDLDPNNNGPPSVVSENCSHPGEHPGLICQHCSKPNNVASSNCSNPADQHPLSSDQLKLLHKSQNRQLQIADFFDPQEPQDFF